MEKKTIRSNTVFPPQHFTVEPFCEVFVTFYGMVSINQNHTADMPIQSQDIFYLIATQWIKYDYMFAHLFPSLKLDS